MEVLNSVQEGDYSAERAAQKLNVSISKLKEMMKERFGK